MFLHLLLLTALQTSVVPASPQCSIKGSTVVKNINKIPADVLKSFPSEMANPNKPFRTGDAIYSGEEHWPSLRLICAYPTLRGYIVEREQGGRGYNRKKVVFRKSATGYVLE